MMETAFTVAWFMWAPLSAWLMRAAIVRAFQKSMGDGAYVVAWIGWILGLFAGVWFVGWSGMQMYGFDQNDPWQFAGGIVFWLSPFGLPVLFGAPIVFVVDLIRFAIQARSERSAPGGLA